MGPSALLYRGTVEGGFRDSVNLGWKIPLVLSRVCDDALLNSYRDERDAHARDLVLGVPSGSGN